MNTAGSTLRPHGARVRDDGAHLEPASASGAGFDAGAFLACQKSVSDGKADRAADATKGVEPKTVDAALVDAAPEASLSDGSAQEDVSRAITDASTDASKALVKVHRGGRDAAAVDRNEHRKRMPVPDNLLE